MENSPYKLRVIILWILLIIGMILHFNNYVSGIFYGVDVKRPNATGIIPASAQLRKALFYLLPMIFVVALLYMRQKWFRIAMLTISGIYTISHVMHVWDEISKPKIDLAQLPLLSLVLIFSLILNKASWDYYKNEK